MPDTPVPPAFSAARGIALPTHRRREVDPRLVRLRRTKWLATGLLAAMAGLYIATVLFPGLPASSYLRAFAEAAVVGGCADWFAVTALFRRPLGLPIPHTAILPRNKERIGAALGRFIVDNFLAPRVLDERLKSLELASWGGGWLQRPENALRIAEAVVGFAPALLKALPEGMLEELAGALVQSTAKSVPAAPAASRLLAAVWNQGRAQPLVEEAVIRLKTYLALHQDVIFETVHGQSWRWTPAWIDRAIAAKITEGVMQLLDKFAHPDHPWRRELAEKIEALISDLANDPELLAKGEALKQRLLDDPRVAQHAHRLWTDARRRLEQDWALEAEALQLKLQETIVRLGVWLSGDKVVQRTLNTGARALVRRFLAPRRHEIGRFVSEVVDSWDSRSLVERLELQVGPDLQYIRVNGALVGGLVGLAIYGATQLLRLAGP